MRFVTATRSSVPLPLEREFCIIGAECMSPVGFEEWKLQKNMVMIEITQRIMKIAPRRLWTNCLMWFGGWRDSDYKAVSYEVMGKGIGIGKCRIEYVLKSAAIFFG